MQNYMLSTNDNPFNPYTHWDEWYAFDVAAGYNTSAYLARIVLTSDEMSSSDQRIAIQEAIDEILELNVLGIYIKVNEPKAVA